MFIFHLLNQLPDLGVLAVTLIVITGVAMLAPHIGRHLLRFPKNDARDDAAFDAYKSLMGMIGVVLAFSLVQATNNLRQVEDTVVKEASAIATVDRILLRSGKPELIAMRPLLAKFGQSLVDDEWPLLARGERSDAASQAYTNLSKAARATNPEDARQQVVYAELLKALDDVFDLREEILADSEIGLPEFFWITALGLLILGLVLAGLTASNLGRTVGVGAPAAGVALLLAFVIIVDLPFEGESSVGPGPIKKTLAINARRL
jgi:hypothetical protein